MVEFKGRNGFKVIWDCDKQSYRVFRDGLYFGITKYRFSEIRSYL